MNAMVTSTRPAVLRLRLRPCDTQTSRSLILVAAPAQERGFLGKGRRSEPAVSRLAGAKFLRSISAYDQSMR
jgi:hypothetical protein